MTISPSAPADPSADPPSGPGTDQNGDLAVETAVGTGILDDGADVVDADVDGISFEEELRNGQAAAAGPLTNRVLASADRRTLADSVSLGIALVLSLFVFALLNWPDPNGWGDLAEPLLFLNTTPSGGDMGAHVWGPAFLRDHLLPNGLLSGWTPDWYAGFPAYHFYMVVPSLAIVAVNAGLPWYLGLPVAAAVIYGGWRYSARFATARNWVKAATILLAVLLVSFPYGVSFKLVSVAGLVMFPLAAWAMGRLARSPEPVPAFLSLAAFVFLFDTNFTIYGGNIASTLAGEFAFSLSLCLCLLAMGMTVRGMDDRRWRAPAAVVIALAALCHIIPVFFLVPALILLVLMHADVPRAWSVAGIVAVALIPIAFADGTGLGVRGLAVVAVLVVLISAAVAEPLVLARSVWLAFTGIIAMALAAFWLLPFYLREPYFNDMGWERLDEIGPPMLTVPIKIALPVAAMGVVLSFALRERMGMIFSGTALLFASAVANVGEGPLWNARLLPFYYLSVYILAAVGVALVVRYIAASSSGDLENPDRRTVVGASAVALLAVLAAVSMPLRIMPFGQLSSSGDGSYQWLAFTNQARSFIPGWADWNYSGYERKPAYAEYNNVVETMATVGETEGCGRAMWEYEKGLDRYGTPMALMLLPHWTDGCIGSMEGLYFESSSSTPFHFLNQSTLSEAPSRAQRDLPYQGFDINKGVAQLQVTGVRYYLAQSDVAIEAARSNAYLTEIAEAQPFVVFEVGRSELVESLAFEPVVASGRTAEDLAGEFGEESEISRFETGWASQAVQYYNDPEAFGPMPAEDGPEEWIRLTTLESEAARPLDPVEVTMGPDDIGTNRISFSVDQVGTPVLVKVSYFPNWKVDGADGPWRIGPNLMVVVPTENEVTLSYGRTLIDLGSILLTLLGLGGLWFLAGIDRRRWEPLERLGLGGGAMLPVLAAPRATTDGTVHSDSDSDTDIDTAGLVADERDPDLGQFADQVQDQVDAAAEQASDAGHASDVGDAGDGKGNSVIIGVDTAATATAELGPRGFETVSKAVPEQPEPSATPPIEPDLAEEVESTLDATLDRKLEQAAKPTTDQAIDVEQPPAEGGGSEEG